VIRAILTLPRFARLSAAIRLRHKCGRAFPLGFVQSRCTVV
jgi:hypothetical protein